MTNEIFTIVKNKPRVTPEGLTIPELLAVWKDDKTNDKFAAQASLAYVYHTVHPKSVYRNYPEKERESIIISDLRKTFGTSDRWTPSENCIAAKKKYSEMISTPTKRMLDAAKSTADKLADYFEGVDFSLTNPETGQPVYDAKKVVDTLKQLEGAVQTIDALKKKVDLELEEASTVNYGNKGYGKFADKYKA